MNVYRVPQWKATYGRRQQTDVSCNSFLLDQSTLVLVIRSFRVHKCGDHGVVLWRPNSHNAPAHSINLALFVQMPIPTSSLKYMLYQMQPYFTAA